jgi:hypothetical protein
MIKTKTKAEKLNETYECLRNLGKVHTKKDFADAIEFDKTNLSSAFRGAEKYLTDGLFKKICYKYPDLFNVEYFLEDKGEMIKSNAGKESTQPNIEEKEMSIPASFVKMLFEERKTHDEINRELVRQNGILIDTLKIKLEEIEKNTKEILAHMVVA